MHMSFCCRCAPFIAESLIIWCRSIDIGNNYLRACMRVCVFSSKSSIRDAAACWSGMLRWDLFIYEPEPTAATSLTLIRDQCMHIYGWLVAHFCTQGSFFFLVVYRRSRSRNGTHVHLFIFASALLASVFQWFPRAGQHEHVWHSMIHLHFRWLSSHYSDKQKERKPQQQQTKRAEKATGDSSRARLCMIYAAS